jgi:5-formyltetrahydrofolate cyclo-ligase
LERMPAEERTTGSQAACLQLKRQPLWRGAQAILFYAPLATEPDLWPLLLDALVAGKIVTLPRFSKEQNHYVASQIKDASRDVRTGRFDVREPLDSCPEIPLNALDLILVPGIAFDLSGCRLGRGGGYYDRLLAVPRGPACGVAFDRQIVSQIPSEPHDIRLNCILTPTRWQAVTGPRAVLK